MASPTYLGSCSVRTFEGGGITSPLVLPVTFDIPATTPGNPTTALIFFYGAPTNQFGFPDQWSPVTVSDDVSGVAIANQYNDLGLGDGAAGSAYDGTDGGEGFVPQSVGF